MHDYILDGSEMTDRVAAHEEIASVLDLPSWYGANLDALADVLAGLHIQLYMRNTAVMLNALRQYGCDMLKIFYDSPIDFIAE